VIVHGRAAPQKPARVVVLGARGFIAQALRRRLEGGGLATLAVSSAELDLSSLTAADKLAALLRPDDALVMLAAITPDKGRDAAALMKNLAMMQSVCAALGKRPCAHLVYFSSDAVYGPGPSLVSEATAAAPGDLYGTMHLARELMAKGISGVPLVVLRPTGVYGSGDTHGSYGPNRFRRSALEEGKIRLFGAGEETRDHVHVDDVAEIAARCLERRSTGLLNVATGRSVSFRELAGIVARQAGKPVEIEETPRAGPVTHRHYDVAALLRAFPGFRFAGLEEDRWAK
jgi:nucleoside-diphosphate-sugar epimerase